MALGNRGRRWDVARCQDSAHFGGFDALLPKRRADRGQSRSLPPEVVDVLLEIKEGNPKLSVQLVIREARRRDEVPDELPLPNSASP